LSLPLISVVIPAFNEADSIVSTLKVLERLEELAEVIVVDDGSTDATATLAEKLGVKVKRLENNQGKGEAVFEGVRLASYPLVALVDADLGFSAVEIKKLILPVSSEKADMAVAVFPERRSRGGWGMVKRVARWSVFILTGRHLKEPLSGQRVLRKEIIDGFSCPPRGFGLETALNLAALRRGYRLEEVEVEMYHRERGKDAASFLHRGKQMMAVIKEFWRGAVLR